MINRAVLTGRLTRNVDVRYTKSGVAVGNFTLAVDRPFTNRNGQREADFIRCVIWRKSAENLANFTHKGSLIGVDGQIQTGSYQNQKGETVYTTNIVVESFSLLEPRSTQTQQQAPQQQQSYNQQPQFQNSQPQYNQSRQPRQPQQPRNNQGQSVGNTGNMPNGSKQVNISNDDLPF